MAGLLGCYTVDLPKITDSRGNLSFIEGRKHVPFDISRVYYLYDVPGGEARGGHAHKKLRQLMIAVAGSFVVRLNDGFGVKEFFLNSPHKGLIVGPMVWREIDQFSSGSVCLVCASMPYEEDDYFRDYGNFLVGAGAAT